MADTLHWRGDGAEVHKVVVGPMDNNVFVLRCTETGSAVLVDAANEGERLLELARSLGVGSVLTTHGHWDHIQAVPAVRAAGYRVAVAAPDASMLDEYDDTLEDDASVEVGRLRLRTILTPGHTPGSMCFKLEGAPLLFSGDTLFPGGPGNTEKDPDRFATILASIGDRLFPLGDDVQVLPGHGDDTTIGRERPSFDTWAERGW
ncbi:MBL fold metallo-hydrolase [soil metagenome]|nr:MBL fold metallo-hydrolase [Acidimicrobiia bacterium]